MRFLVSTGLLSLCSLAAANTVVDLGYARYRGNQTYPNTVAYLGIPYAEPPLNNLRWRAPLPLNTARVSRQARGAVIDATSYPDFCVQGTTGNGDAGGAGSEDCLKVNVYAPANAKKGDRFPVLVYMHGGGYIYGNPRNWPFDHWVNQMPEVVIVSVYYRLDSFGFLAHPAFTSSPELGDLNVGIQDQTQALRWVQSHIDAFGGDPGRVTINGQSAGASSVEIHLVAPQQEGLFHGAIAQSVYRTPLPTPQQQEPMFNFFAERIGCSSKSLSWTMACLRNASISAIAQAQDAFNGSYNLFHPVMDGKTIPIRPTPAVLASKMTKVPLMVGATSNETLSGGTDISAALKTYFPLLSDKDLAEYAEQYPFIDFVNATQQFRFATGESELKCATQIMGGAYAQHSKAYVYRYNTPTPGSPFVEHAAENWMMFKGTSTGFNGTTTFSPQTPSDDAFAEELIAYWLSFVRSANPNTYKLARSPEWPAYSTKSLKRMVLTEGTVNKSGSAVETIPSGEMERCAFVAGKAQVQQA